MVGCGLPRSRRGVWRGPFSVARGLAKNGNVPWGGGVVVMGSDFALRLIGQVGKGDFSCPPSEPPSLIPDVGAPNQPDPL